MEHALDTHIKIAWNGLGLVLRPFPSSSFQVLAVCYDGGGRPSSLDCVKDVKFVTWTCVQVSGESLNLQQGYENSCLGMQTSQQ